MNKEDMFELMTELSINTEDTLLCDKDKSYSICEYKLTALFSPSLPSQKILTKTLNYIRVYYDDYYLGIARRDDPRFDKTGKYICQN